MSGPKHLWSGDWQRESDAASSSRAHRAPRAAEPDSAEPTAPPRPVRPRRQLKRPRVTVTGAIVAATVLVLAGVAFGVSSLLGSSSPGPRSPHSTPAASVPTVPTAPSQTAPPTQSVPPTQTAPQTTPVANTPTVSWLGMQIATEPPGAAVVQTVRIGSAADRAGISPGEVIQAVNGRSIGDARDIVGAIRGVARGTRVTLSLTYGSGSSQAELPTGAPPSVSP